MALLRDARTSAVILEGTPEEVALAAAELDDGAYLFDDVGERFDADAVRQAHADRVAGLEGALEEARAAQDPAVESLTAALEQARAPAETAPANAETAAAAAADAQAELERA